jgi:HKD family nuclease
MRLIVQPLGDESLGDLLQGCLKGERGNFTLFQAAVAFIKRSGVQHIAPEIEGFLARGGSVQLVVGVDQQGTSIEGLSDLLQVMGERGKIWISHDENPFVTFHPKIYLFEGAENGLLIIGSGNLTQGGLYSNDEGSAVFNLDLTIEEDRELLNELKAAFQFWCDDQSGTARGLDQAFLQELVDKAYVRPEVEGRQEPPDDAADSADEVVGERQPARTALFDRRAGRRRPPRPRRYPLPKKKGKFSVPSIVPSGKFASFVMTLMRTDVGTGQVTRGAARRSPEIFVPLRARNANPDFWGWPDEFREDPARPKKFDRSGVKMKLGGATVTVNMMTWPVKHDFRLRSEALRSAGDIGDIIRIEKSDGSRGFDYYVEIVPQGTANYNHYLGFCKNKVPNSDRRWGYV